MSIRHSFWFPHMRFDESVGISIHQVLKSWFVSIFFVKSKMSWKKTPLSREANNWNSVHGCMKKKYEWVFVFVFVFDLCNTYLGSILLLDLIFKLNCDLVVFASNERKAASIYSLAFLFQLVIRSTESSSRSIFLASIYLTAYKTSNIS